MRKAGYRGALSDVWSEEMGAASQLKVQRYRSDKAEVSFDEWVESRMEQK